MNEAVVIVQEEFACEEAETYGERGLLRALNAAEDFVLGPGRKKLLYLSLFVLIDSWTVIFDHYGQLVFPELRTATAVNNVDLLVHV